MAKLVDLTGQTFGQLTIIHRAGGGGNGKSVTWTCQCTCGNLTTVSRNNLRNGSVRSCGCQSGNRSHGLSKSPEYRSWRSMKSRCGNPKAFGYRHYGGRGITVHPEWAASFEAFFRDMGPRPSLGHSIDRIDTDGNYEPGNCRWATRSEQRRNMRSG